MCVRAGRGVIFWRGAVGALRQIMVGIGGKENGMIREDGYDIVVASEVKSCTP